MSASQVSSRSNRKQIVVTGIPTVSAMPVVNIYPNPSKDIVTIALSQPEDAIITLNNVLGQTIYTDKLNSDEKVKQLNLSEVKDGVY
ncbi:MAG TPA: T9SS type A sorting domain-containing protein, partial [Bacteroidia bacterium]|nr:T9SS type A sorting domain-containing protein [Bacteroidia bacterium]